MQWYLAVLKKYVDFSGRARRKEFWMFALFNTIIVFLLSSIDNMIGTAPDMGGSGMADGPWMFSGSTGVLGGLYTLAVLLPGLAVSVRRLHDTNRSGWWYLINFVPCIGWIIFIVFAVMPGDQGPNNHGEDPKAYEGGTL